MNFEELTEQQQKEILKKEIFKLESRKIQTRATQDCTEFETQQERIKEHIIEMLHFVVSELLFVEEMYLLGLSV